MDFYKIKYLILLTLIMCLISIVYTPLIAFSKMDSNLETGSITIKLGRSEIGFDAKPYPNDFSTSAHYSDYGIKADYFPFDEFGISAEYSIGSPEFRINTGSDVEKLNSTLENISTYIKHRRFFSVGESQGLLLVEKIGYQRIGFSIDDFSPSFVPDHNIEGMGLGAELDLLMNPSYKLFFEITSYPLFKLYENPEISGSSPESKGLSYTLSFGVKIFIKKNIESELGIELTNFRVDFSGSGSRGGVAVEGLEVIDNFNQGYLGLRYLFY